jgi:GDSL-like Lipase/Acylhydrolase family
VPKRGAVLGSVVALGVLASVEGIAALVIAVGNGRFSEPIRRRSAIYAEQTARIRQLLRTDPERLLVLDSVLGWRYRPSHVDSMNQTNAAGLRSTHEYPTLPRRRGTRVAAFGDSFVYGNEVANRDAWPTLLERMDSSLDVLNYGVGGYGTDQAFLRYRGEGSRLRPSVIIIGFVPDDIRRVVNVYRRFLSVREIPITKPRFVLDGTGRLVLRPNPVPDSSALARFVEEPAAVRDLGQDDYWYEPAIYANPLYDWSAAVRLGVGFWIRVRRRYIDGDRVVRAGALNIQSEAFRIQMALFDEFARAAREAGARPLALLFPDRESLAETRATGHRLLDPLATALRARHIETVDVTDAFLAAEQKGAGGWFMPGGHYSPAGNRLVATTVLGALRASAVADRGTP